MFPTCKATADIEHIHSSTFVSVKRYITAKGDTGGSMYSEGFALGVHSGRVHP